MTDPGLPPKPVRSLNLLESLVLEEEEKDKNKGVTNVTIPTSGIESSTNSDSQDYNEQLDRENSASSFKEFKMKDIDTSKGVRSNLNAGFKGKKISKRRSRSHSSERGKKKGKLIRPFSADYKQEQRNKIMSKGNRPKTSKGTKRSPQYISRKGRSSSRSSSADSYSDHFEEDKESKYNQRQALKDDFFDSDEDAHKGSKTNYIYGAKKDSVSETKDDSEKENKGIDLSEKQYRSESESSADDNKPGPSGTTNGHVSRSTRRKDHKHKNVHKRKVTRQDTEGDNYEVVVEDYSSSFSSSSDDESHSKEKLVQITNGNKHRSKKLLRKKKVLKPNTLIVDPDKYLEAKVHQKYLELEDLMTCSFVDQRKNITRQQLYQMELLRDQYHTVSHGLPSSHVIIPRSLPGDVRSTGNRPQSGNRTKTAGRPWSAGRPSSGRWAQHVELSDEESYDKAYGTLRSVMDAEQARVMHGIRTDVIAVRAGCPKKKPKKKKIDATLKAKENQSEEEDISEKPSVRSTSSENTPRKMGPTIDDHIKYSKNEQLKRWLKEKNKIYRKQIKEEKIKKREERDKLINEANDKIEKRLASQKHVKKWMYQKNKELWKKHQEEKRREEEEMAERKRMEVNLPGDSMKIRPQSAPAVRPDDVKVDEQNCKGEETPNYVKDQIHKKRELEDENKQIKLAKQEPHPPQTKFIYKRPVAGKIKFKMQQDRPKSPHNKEQMGQNAGIEKGMRMSYDDWLKKKRRDDSAKRREADRNKELAKSDPELDRIIPALAKKRVENILNQRKRIDTGMKQHDENINKAYGGSDHSGDESGRGRPRSAYRLAGEKSEGPALTVKQVRPQTAPTTRVPHPKKSVNSPRKAVIPQKADAIMSNDDQSNPYALPFPPELGVPKYVAERQRKIFADQINQRLAEAEQQEQETVEKTETVGSENKLEDPESRDTADTHTTEHPVITQIMYSPKKREDTSESSSEEEQNKSKEPETKIEIKEGVKTDTEKEQRTLETESLNQDSKVTDSKHIGVDKTEEQRAFEDSQSVESKESENSAGIDIESKDEKLKDTNTDINEKLLRAAGVENLNDIGFGPPIIMSKAKDSDDESDSDNENVSMSNSGTNTDSEKESIKYETTDREKLKDDDDAHHLVGILKENKGLEGNLMPEKVNDKTFAHSETKFDDTMDIVDEAASKEGATSHKRVSFNEQPTVFQSFESSSTDTITPEQPGELNPEEDGLDAQESLDYDDETWEDGGNNEETLSLNIAGVELKAKVIKSADENSELNEPNDKQEKDKEATTFITDPSKE